MAHKSSFYQVAKQKALIQKLFKAIIADNPELQCLNIELDITEGYGNDSNCYSDDRKLIFIKLNTIENRAKEGYTNFYYAFRSNKINPYILNNRHNVYRFVLLHELAHALHYYNTKGQCRDDTLGKEFFADDYALSKLKPQKQGAYV